jgi:hypothetical protein
MTAKITLSNPSSTISPGNGIVNFGGGGGSYQEALYTVTAQDTVTKQAYVAVVSEGPQYYYVDAVKGDDTWPDVYNGGSEALPFKTLAYAVQEATKPGSTISKIFIMGDLSAATEAETSVAKDPNSAFTLDLSGATNKEITITSTTGATLRGTSGKRVLTIKGGADLIFENINITGGNAASTNTDAGKGGGIYVTGNSKVKFSGGSITGNTAYSGGGVYVEGSGTKDQYSQFTLMGDATISGNTANGAASGEPAVSAMGGGGGVYVKDNALFWLAGGTVSDNTTKGAGGGVLVNGSVFSSTPVVEYGLLMSGGKIINNKTTSTTYPHGGGGVYVAGGAFEMLDGSITGNYSQRQGGGVFVHWGPDNTTQPRFTASGNSLITGNDGVGSSHGICNRGTTELIGNAQTDTAYVWDYNDSSVKDQAFTLGENARIGGIALAYSAENKNFLTIATTGVAAGTDQICRIDLEGHLTNGSFKTFNPDEWKTQTLIKGVAATLNPLVSNKRIVLGTYTGSKTIFLTDKGYEYIISVDGSGNGKLDK